MDFTRSALGVRIVAVTVAAIVLPMLSLTVQAGPPTSNATDNSTTVFAEHADRAVVTKSVSYEDLNLASPKGFAQLMARVKAAINEVCQPADNNMDLLQVEAER